MIKAEKKNEKGRVERPDLQMDRINHLTEEIASLYHAAALKLGLADSVLAILYTLSTMNGECGITDICFTAGMSKQTVNSALRKLEREGAVVLKAIDGKKKKAALTEKGAGLAEKTAKKLIRAENNALSSWKEEEVSEYLRLMKKFFASLKEQIDKIEV